jgi:DNA-binding response OmpR family regulator
MNLSFFRNLIIGPAVVKNNAVARQTSQLRVLLIEGDEADRKKLSKALRPSFEVIELGDEYDAIRYVARNTIDIALITDALFQNVNAGRILYSLRENSAGMFRAFALTAHYSEPQVVYLRTAGFEQVLVKPVDELLFNDLVYFNKVVM